MIEAIAAVLIFGTLIGAIVGLVGFLVYRAVRVANDGQNYDRGGGYKTGLNQNQYRQGKIPHKFTGQYHQETREQS